MKLSRAGRSPDPSQQMMLSPRCSYFITQLSTVADPRIFRSSISTMTMSIRFDNGSKPLLNLQRKYKYAFQSENIAPWSTLIWPGSNSVQ
jgi:hypothetical protein